MSRQLDPDLEAALKKLRLGKMIPTMPERIALAEKSKMAFEELLLLLLRDEIDRRASTATARRTLSPNRRAVDFTPTSASSSISCSA